MKRIFVGLVILAMFVVPPVMAESTSTLAGIAAGWTADYFNEEPMRNVVERARPEASVVLRLSQKVWSMPGIDWATNTGLVRIVGAIYTHVYTWKSISFYTGGSMSALQFATDGVVKVNSQLSGSIDVGGTWRITKGVRMGLALKQEAATKIGDTEPIVKSETRVTTLKIGTIISL